MSIAAKCICKARSMAVQAGATLNDRHVQYGY